MNWKKWTITLLICLFVAINLFLILKKDTKIARSSYIKEWTTVVKQDITQTKNSQGVVAPAEIGFSYYDNANGPFKQFMVKEGDQVDIGTPLFEYSPDNIDQAISLIEAEITKLENDLDGLETNIDNLEDLHSSLLAEEDNEEKHLLNAISSVEAQIFEKESQKAKLEAEIEKNEELLSSNETMFDTLTVSSNISGVVKEINHALQNPLITIASNEIHVEGIAGENEVLKIAEGMKVRVYTESMRKPIEGMISTISSLPLEKPTVKTETEYGFTVQLAEMETQILQGTHVNLTIVTQEIEDALTVPSRALHKSSLYVLRDNGEVEKQDVQLGNLLNNTQEITSGVEEGNIIAIAAKRANNKAYFTPVKIQKLNKSALSKMGKKESAKYVAKGILSR
ncbi:efflux RND transporter periplasmic adaptor subunit [Cytobacillus sp. FJAT-54145]|uniref:Efflux RND transporter periplasmic adaptor subunit n=1 Tax=Cytobacillus spartinae TaxID=3299023 RepID=A0ABW6KC20_9BACI